MTTVCESHHHATFGLWSKTHQLKLAVRSAHCAAYFPPEHTSANIVKYSKVIQDFDNKSV